MVFTPIISVDHLQSSGNQGTLFLGYARILYKLHFILVVLNIFVLARLGNSYVTSPVILTERVIPFYDVVSNSVPPLSSRCSKAKTDRWRTSMPPLTNFISNRCFYLPSLWSYTLSSVFKFINEGIFPISFPASASAATAKRTVAKLTITFLKISSQF